MAANLKELGISNSTTTGFPATPSTTKAKTWCSSASRKNGKRVAKRKLHPININVNIKNPKNYFRKSKEIPENP